MKIALFSSKPYDQEYFEKYVSPYPYKITYFEAALNMDTVGLSEGFDAICVFVNDKVNQEVIRRLSEYGIKLIALRCAGFNNVDLEAAKAHNIKVARVPSYSPASIAEHSMALILTLSRKTHKAYNRVREGNFSLNRLMGFNLKQKTVGVIGTGKIGAAFCEILAGFGCNILAYDLYPSDTLKKGGVRYVSIGELLKSSDIISLHCPLTPDTKHLIDKEAIAMMKQGVMVINTSRGALIKTEDAIDGLTRKKIGYLGIDVYEQEENLFFQDLSESIIQDDLILRLNSFPNVLITSHQAFFTREAMEEITTITLKNIQEFEKGEKLSNEVSG